MRIEPRNDSLKNNAAAAKNNTLEIKTPLTDIALNNESTSKVNTICANAVKRKYKNFVYPPFCSLPAESADTIKYDDKITKIIDNINIIYFFLLLLYKII